PVVGIPQHGQGEPYFKDLQERAARRNGSRDGVFAFQLIPNVSHRPFFVTRPVALWLKRQLDFPNWTEATIHSLPETHITRWAAAYAVPLDRLYAGEDREGGTRALGENVPALSRTTPSGVGPGEWERKKGRLIYESWVEAARARVKEGP